MSMDREALAWAAGFFDGEGTAVLDNLNSKRVNPTTGRRRDYPTPQLAVSQYHDPETIHRFHAAVGGLGTVFGPHRSPSLTGTGPRWSWQCRRPAEVLAVVPMLWPWLSGPKRRQIAGVLQAYLADAAGRRPYRHTQPQGVK